MESRKSQAVSSTCPSVKLKHSDALHMRVALIPQQQKDAITHMEISREYLLCYDANFEA
jgi:hypothetical protein